MPNHSLNRLLSSLEECKGRFGRGETHRVEKFENWALVLALISDLAGWTPPEKRDLVKILRAKTSRNEMQYLRLTQKHPRLRRELLRLGSHA